MNIAFYTAASGVKVHQQSMDTISNNMANVNTNGYKKLRSSFSELLYTDMTYYAKQEGRDIMTGHGARQVATDFMFGQGSPVQTDGQLDFAITGEGFFGIRTKPDNELRYTRDGNFSLQINGNKVNLMTANGDAVTDSKGKAIEVPMDSLGNVDYEALVPMIGLFKFENPYSLLPTGNNLYQANDRTGKASVAGDDVVLRQGMLEGSNVDLSQEMTNVITAQRGFQFNAKVVQVADEMEQVVNSLR